MFSLDRREPSRRRRPSAQEVPAPQGQEPDRPEPPVAGGGGRLLPAAFAATPFLPYRKILGFRSGKKIHTVISTLRKFKLKHGRHKHFDSSEGKAALHSQQRLCASHPNVSTSDLASAALPPGVHISDGASYSDPTIHRNSSASSSPARGRARDDEDAMRDSGITIDSPAPGIVVSCPSSPHSSLCDDP
ncbi:hypothetical protein CEXT_741331, partial [Caerostris extrusa]